jgi:hypothetical protein
MSIVENDINEDVYIGLELPLTHTSTGFFNRTKTALEQAKSNIKNLLLTNKGERLGNPTFGTNLLRLVFSQENTDLERAAMSEFLPYINIRSIETSFSDTNINQAIVRIIFTLNIDLSEDEELTIDLSNYNQG